MFVLFGTGDTDASDDSDAEENKHDHDDIQAEEHKHDDKNANPATTQLERLNVALCGFADGAVLRETTSSGFFGIYLNVITLPKQLRERHENLYVYIGKTKQCLTNDGLYFLFTASCLGLFVGIRINRLRTLSLRCWSTK